MEITPDYLRSYNGKALDLSSEDSSKHLSLEQIKALATNTILRSLDLSYNQIGDEGAVALAAGANKSSLRRLDLICTRMKTKGIKALADNTILRSLNLAYNEIGDESITALASCISLRNLDLSLCYIKYKEILILTSGAINMTLRRLILRYSKIEDEGAKALATITSLRYLDLSGNEITDDGAMALANNKNLRFLGLSNNPISSEGNKTLNANISLRTFYSSREDTTIKSSINRFIKRFFWQFL